MQLAKTYALWAAPFSLLWQTAASAVSMDWKSIEYPGNACDSQPDGCYGAVDHPYLIGTYEVTNAQYTEFLNAKAAADPFNLWNPLMGSTIYGGIARTGAPGGPYSYGVAPGRGDMPVNFVSFYDAARFANWMNNGQGSGDTETGAYSMLGEAVPSSTVTRNPGALVFLPSEDEWYKAAYYDGDDVRYFDFPASSSLLTQCVAPTATGNRANCNNAVGNLTSKGSYPGSGSPSATFDQGGNVSEWNEALIADFYRGLLGGEFDTDAFSLGAFSRRQIDATSQSRSIGFRLAAIPEPGTGVLLAIGLFGLAIRRRASEQRGEAERSTD